MKPGNAAEVIKPHKDGITEDGRRSLGPSTGEAATRSQAPGQEAFIGRPDSLGIIISEPLTYTVPLILGAQRDAWGGPAQLENLCK